ncbi:MAG: hypothetical protein EBR82_24260 [Caulobacteraceae bacterium]|nr:hypothetical protein [Caulobacteraceae bacterium]
MATTYVDCNGKEWKLRLSVASGEKVKNDTGVDFATYTTLAKLQDDAILARVCFILSGEPSGEEESFIDGIDGDTKDRMEAAIWSELENFSRGRQRTVIQAARDKANQVVQQEAERIAKQISEITIDVFGKIVTNSADTSERTPSE